MQQPEAYIGDAGSLFDKAGKLANQKTKAFLGKFLAAFEARVSALRDTSADGGFADFLAQREKIAAAYSSGDVALLDAIVAREGKATFFPPTGGSVSGAAKVAARYDSDAKAFAAGSHTKLKVLQAQASDGVAFWTGLQDFDGEIGGHSIKMRLRITELFCRDADGWKLVHRHADPASTPSQKPR
jgi:ketosteroid isomerase-like protein